MSPVFTDTLETVVTSLEMLSPPTRPSVPAPMGKLALLRLDPPTLSFYRFLYDTVGADWAWTDRRLMDDDDLAEAILTETIEIYVLYSGGVPAGFCEIDRAEFDDMELKIWPQPGFIGHGLGWYFLNWAIDKAWSTGPKQVWVHTCDLDHPRPPNIAGFVAYNRAPASLLIRDFWVSNCLPTVGEI